MIEPYPAHNWWLSYHCMQARTPLYSELTDIAHLDADTGHPVMAASSTPAFTGGSDHDNQVFVVSSALPDVGVLSRPFPLTLDNSVIRL